jgi:quaternary ammonium compound-resistance protein SugE
MAFGSDRIMIALSLGLVGSFPESAAGDRQTGLGSVGTVALGIVLSGESAALSRLACLGLIVTGILGLELIGE